MSEQRQPRAGRFGFGELPPPAASGKATTAVVLGLASLLCGLVGPIAVFLGIAALAEIGRSQGRVGGKGKAVTGLVLGGFSTFLFFVLFPLAILLPAVLAAREAARRSMSSGHLKQIVVGMHNYHDVYNTLPMTGSLDPQAGVHLSWRARLLPFIEHMAEYEQLDFSQPWDAPPNARLHDQMPATYGQPGKEAERRKTQYVTFTYDGRLGPSAPDPTFSHAQAWFHPRQARPMSACLDGTANTILAVEADPERAVPWLKPADLALDPSRPKAGVGNNRPGGFLAVMGDGSVRFISNKIDDPTMLKLILCDDGHSLTAEALDPRTK